MTDFLHMGGYALYVWSSYGLALVVMVATVYAPIMKKKQILSDISRKLRRERNSK